MGKTHLAVRGRVAHPLPGGRRGDGISVLEVPCRNRVTPTLENPGSGCGRPLTCCVDLGGQVAQDRVLEHGEDGEGYPELPVDEDRQTHGAE